jgi:hypothetical protein
VRRRFPTHLRTFLFLAPFFAMLVVHRALGLADNLLAAPEPGKPDGAVYNLIMVMVLWAGLLGFFVHTALHARESPGWAFAKLAVQGGIIGAMVHMCEAAN